MIAWNRPPEGTKVYRCPAILTTDPIAGFSIVSANLPGCGSQGDTVPEAIANFKEAITGCLRSYNDHKEAIPWSKDESQEEIGQSWRVTVFVYLEEKCPE